MSVSLKTILLKFFSARIIGMFLMTVSSIVIARYAGPEIFGQYGVITAYFALALVPLASGASNLLIRLIASRPGFGIAAHNQVCRRMRTASALTSVVFIGILASSFWQEIGMFDFLQLGLAVWLSQLTALHLSVLRGLGKPHWAIVADQVIKPLVLVAGVLIMVSIDFYDISLNALITVFTVASVVGYIYSRRMLAKLKSANVQQNESDLPDLTGFNWKNPELIYLSVVSFAYALNSSIEVFILDWQSEYVLIGQFKVLAQVATLSGLVYVSVNYLAVERFSRLVDNNSFKQSRDSQILAGLSLLGASFLPLILLFTSQDILILLFGKEYSFSGSALWVLLAAQLLNGLFGMSNSLLISRGESKMAMRLMLLVLILKVITAPLLIMEYGIEGAAWSSFLGLVLYKLLVWGYCLQRFGLDTSVLALHAARNQNQRFEN